jgi:hypothetical protein
MKKNLRYVLLLLPAFCVFCLPLYSQDAEQPEASYRIRESQLQKLVTLYQQSQGSRQTALLQLKVLQTKALTLQNRAETLQQESVRLQGLLQTERTTTQSLAGSVSKLETSLQTQEKQAAQIQQNYNNEKLSHQKTKNQRNILLCITLVLTAGIAGYIVLKIKKVLTVV